MFVNEPKPMRAKNLFGRFSVASLSLLVLLGACAVGQDVSTSANSGSSGPEEIFASPEQAIDALVEANRQGNKAELLKVLGPDGAKLVSSGDPVEDKNGRDKFLSAYDADHKFETRDDASVVLILGEEEWPMPIPLVAAGDGWRFDTKAGADEILNRRIGRNEINAIGVCRAYVEAQREYAEKHTLPDGTRVYAQHLISSHGQQNGLYWPSEAGEEESPLGPLVAYARDEGYVGAGGHRAAREPYNGYYFKILKQQGTNAADGAKNYVVHGHMTGGFALIAYPAVYNDSGVMTFIVNENGIVFEKNLGPNTAKIARSINAYDPDLGWTIARL